MSGHVNWEEILDYCEGERPPDDPVGEHILHCRRCRELLARAEATLHLLARGRDLQPPADAVDKAAEVLQAELRGLSQPMPGRTVTGGLERLREVLATLVADSLVPSPTVRGAAEGGGPRVLLYETDDYAVTLSLPPATKCSPPDAVLGQIVPRRGDILPAGGRAILNYRDARYEEAVSEDGEFRFDAIPSSPEGLSILLADTIIRLSLPVDPGAK